MRVYRYGVFIQIASENPDITPCLREIGTAVEMMPCLDATITPINDMAFVDVPEMPESDEATQQWLKTYIDPLVKPDIRQGKREKNAH